MIEGYKPTEKQIRGVHDEAFKYHYSGNDFVILLVVLYGAWVSNQISKTTSVGTLRIVQVQSAFLRIL